MNKKIKVFFINFPEINIKNYFPIKVLLDNFNVEIVNNKKNAQLIIGPVVMHRQNDYLDQNKKNIIISGENLSFKRNLFSIIESILHLLIRDKKYKVIDLLDGFFPKFISGFPFIYFFSGYIDVLKKVKRGEFRNIYFLLSEDYNSRNTMVLPFFLQEYYYKLNKLVKREKKNKNNLKNKKFCTMLVGSNSSRERVHFFKKLSKYKKIDSYGKVMNNMNNELFNHEWKENPDINLFNILFGKEKPMPKKADKDLIKKGWKENSELFKQYKFVICFENSFAKEYLTEKLPNALLAGVVPIYRGDPHIKKYFNTRSFIDYNDYKSYKKMIRKIIQLDKNDEEYLKVLNESCFKEDKLPKIFEEKEKELIDFYRRVIYGKR